MGDGPCRHWGSTVPGIKCGAWSDELLKLIKSFEFAAPRLISYVPDTIEPYLRAASYVDRIFKGEKPANLPVQAPTKYQLAINLKTAKALGLAVPPSLLARADEVIE